LIQKPPNITVLSCIWKPTNRALHTLSILLQLQSFFLEEKNISLYIKEDISTSKIYRNLSVNHDPVKGKVWSCASHWDVDVVLGNKKAKRTKVVPKIPSSVKTIRVQLGSKPTIRLQLKAKSSTITEQKSVSSNSTPMIQQKKPSVTKNITQGLDY